MTTSGCHFALTLIFTVCCLVCFASAQSEFEETFSYRLIDVIETDIISRCDETCENTFPKHTYEQGTEQESCKQGCLLYNLSYGRAIKPIDSCFSACNQSYESIAHLKACNTGCEAQQPLEEKRLQEVDDFKSQASMLIQEAKIKQMMSHWMFQLLTGFDVFNSDYSSEESEENTNMIIMESGPGIFKVSQYHVKIGNLIDVELTTEKVPIEQPYKADDDEVDELCWLSVHYQSFLSFVLLLSVIMFIWLAVSVLTTAPKHRVKRVNAKDLNELNDDSEFKIIIANHPFSSEAEALPVKTAII